MRPRRLELTAIGSYGGTVSIDFDGFSPYGLFHIHGPTGAGKSSILDAMCFALYGRVPAPRRSDSLRSHHADQSTIATVTLDFTAQDAEWRIARVPSQVRAKKSGKGTTLQLHEATLHRSAGGRWRPVASKPGEVDQKVRELVGLDAEQFMQVVVLPQGGFQKALRANGAEREALLSTLFHTERFEVYSARLKSRADELEKSLASASTRARGIVISTLSRAAKLGLLSDEAPARSDLMADLDRLQKASAAIFGMAADAEVDRDRAQHRRDRCDETLKDRSNRFERSQRRALARRELEKLEANEQEMRHLREELEAAVRAAPVMPLVREEQDRRVELRSLEALVMSQRDRFAATSKTCHQLIGTPVCREWSDAEHRRGVLAELRSRRDRFSVLALKSQHADEAEAERIEHALLAERHREKAAGAAFELARLEAERDVLVSRSRELEESKVDVDVVSSEVEKLTRQIDAARRLEALRVEEDRLRNVALVEERKALDAQHFHLQLLQRRLDGMANELARQLVDGEACVVCGATEHPIPAVTSEEQVSEVDLQSAEDEARRRRQQSMRTNERMSSLRNDIQALAAVAGEAATDLATIELSLGKVKEALRQSESASKLLDDLNGRLVSLNAATSEITGRRDRAHTATSEHKACEEAARTRAERLRSELSAELGPVADPEEAVTTIDAALLAAENLEKAEGRLHSAQSAMSNIGNKLVLALTEAGFSDAEELRSQAKSREWIAGAQRRLDDHGQAVAASTAVLAELHDVEPVDEEAVMDARRQLSSADAELRAALSRCTTLHDAIEEFAGSTRALESEMRTIEPLEVEYKRVAGLAALCEGRGNDMKMSLKRYVLAAYLEEVAKAASTRLQVMTSGRYTLRHSDERARHGGASGLSLLVTDAHTGVEREVASLSGGETFLASLALALGLADVVQAHTGGVHIEALFIDEGFGSLDADTLELAMAELDRLRAGGRLIGVISHVPTLRDRIGVGLEVVPSLSGSSIRYTGLLDAISA